jgi:hypothetical protein
VKDEARNACEAVTYSNRFAPYEYRVEFGGVPNLTPEELFLRKGHESVTHPGASTIL